MLIEGNTLSVGRKAYVTQVPGRTVNDGADRVLKVILTVDVVHDCELRSIRRPVRVMYVGQQLAGRTADYGHLRKRAHKYSMVVEDRTDEHGHLVFRRYGKEIRSGIAYRPRLRIGRRHRVDAGDISGIGGTINDVTTRRISRRENLLRVVLTLLHQHAVLRALRYRAVTCHVRSAEECEGDKCRANQP